MQYPVSRFLPPRTERFFGLPGSQLFALVYVACSAATFAQTMPVFLAQAAREFALSNRQIGFQGSIEVLGLVAGSLAAATLLLRRMRLAIPIGIAALVLGNCGSAFADSFFLLASSRFIAGTGTGCILAFWYGAAGASAKPGRVFGFIVFTILVFGAGCLQVLSQLIEHLDLRGIALVYAGIAASACWTYWVVPELCSTRACEVGGQESARFNMLTNVRLAALFINYVAEGAVWAFLQRIGEANGLVSSAVSRSIAALSLAGIAGSLAASLLSEKAPRLLALAVALAVLAVGLQSTFAAGSIVQFALGCTALGIYWTFSLPVILGIVVGGDPTKRAAVYAAPIASLGLATGPFVGGLVAHGSDYSMIGRIAFLFSVLAYFAIFLAAVVSERRPRTSA